LKFFCVATNTSQNDTDIAAHAESSTGILTSFPFADVEASYEPSLTRIQSLFFLKYLTPRLGSAHSQLIAIFEITLFSSVEKGFHFSNYYYNQDLHHWLFQSALQQTF